MALITLDAFQKEPASNYKGSTCTLRVWYDRSFLDSSGVAVQQSPNFYFSVGCTIAAGVISVPAFNFYTTVDALDPNAQSIRCFAQFFTNNNTQARDQVFTGNSTPTGWVIFNPDPLTTVTYEQLALENQGFTLINPNPLYPTTQEVIDLINTAAGSHELASAVRLGITKLSVAPISSANPIAVGSNDYATVSHNGITALDIAPAAAASPIAIGVNSRRASDFYSVIAYGAATTNTASANATALAATVTAAASAGGGIYIPVGTFSTNSVTISVPIQFAPGASILRPANGQTVTITKSLIADPSKHFGNATAGQGTISFAGNTSLGNIYPQWWGAVGDDSTDCAPAFQAMLAIVWYNGSIGSARFRIPNGTYRIGTGLIYRGDFGHNFIMEGESQGEAGNQDGPILKYTGSAGGTLLQMLGANMCHINNIQLLGNGLALRDLVFDYDSSRAMSSFDCEVNNCNFAGVTGVDSTCLVLGTSNSASAEHLITRSRFIYHNTPGTSYYAIKNFGSANAKNYTIRDCDIVSFRYGVQLGNSGYHLLDGVSFSGQTIADVRGGTENTRISSCASEGSAMFISGEANNTVAGNLTIEDSYWRGATGLDDYVIEFAGSLNIFNSNFQNDSVGGQVKIKTGFGGLGGSIFSCGNFYDSTGVTLASKPLFYDGSDRLIAMLAAGSEGAGGYTHLVSINDKARAGIGAPVVAFPTWITDLNIYGGTSVANLATQTGAGQYSPSYSDQIILLSASDANRSVFLPIIANVPTGTAYVVIRTDNSGNTAGVDGNGANINGAGTYSLAAQYDFVKVVSNGTLWYIEAQGGTATGTGAYVRTISPTIVTPTIASFVNATHNHSNGAGGGQLTIAAFSSTTGTGAVVGANTPTLITPVIGVATGTSLVTTGLIKSSGTTGIGYATGAGGTVSQLTSKVTGVTLDKVTGTITMNNAALNAGEEVKFTITNSTVAATDVPIVVIKSGGTSGAYLVCVTAVGAGSFDVTLANVSAGNLSEALVLSFAVIKGVAA